MDATVQVANLVPFKLKTELTRVGVRDSDITQLWNDFQSFVAGKNKPRKGERPLIAAFLDLRGSKHNRAIFSQTIRLLQKKVVDAEQRRLRAAS